MADIQGNIIKTDELFNKLNETISKHIGYLEGAADSLANYSKNAKLPSDFLTNQKTYENNQKRILKSTKDL